VNGHQSQLCFDDCGAEIIGSYGADCAYRWWTNSEPPRRSKFTPTTRASAVNPPRREGFAQENSLESSFGCLLIVA
jgi:hypothetical protein